MVCEVSGKGLLLNISSLLPHGIPERAENELPAAINKSNNPQIFTIINTSNKFLIITFYVKGLVLHAGPMRGDIGGNLYLGSGSKGGLDGPSEISWEIIFPNLTWTCCLCGY